MKKSAYILLFVFIFCCQQVFAQPELDTTFNGTGKWNNGTSFTFLPLDGTVQADNKPIALSQCRNTSLQAFQFCFIRLTEGGVLDSTFNNPGFSEPGTAVFAVPNSNINSFGAGRGLVVMPDGKIIAVGSATISNSENPFILRLNSNGTADSTFGTNGFFSYSTGTFFAKVVAQPDGKIVVVGNSGVNQMAARFLPDGTPDNTFGDNGFKILINPAGNTSASSIALQADGKIVLGGSLETTPVSYLLTRLNKDGSLDTTFDDDGYKTIPVSDSASDAFVSIAIRVDGRIVALGKKNIIYQLNSDGSLDTSFDSDGSRPALNGFSTSNRLVVSASGKITVVGFLTLYAGMPTPVNYLINRYLPDGSPDTSFSNDGFLEIDASAQPFDGADVVSFDSLGRMVIGGRTWSGCCIFEWQSSSFTAARLTASPTLNAKFSGRVMNPNGNPVFNAALTLKNGSEIIAYARTNQFGYFNFNNIPTNKTYTISTIAKSLSFYDRTILIDDQVTNFQIFGN